MALSMVSTTDNGYNAVFSRFPTSLKLSLDVYESLTKRQKEFSEYDTASKGKKSFKAGFRGNFCFTDVFVQDVRVTVQVKQPHKLSSFKFNIC